MPTFEEYVDQLYRQVVSEYLLLCEKESIPDSIHRDMFEIYQLWKRKNHDVVWIHSKLEWVDKRLRDIFQGLHPL